MINDTFKFGELTCEFRHSGPGGRDLRGSCGDSPIIQDSRARLRVPSTEIVPVDLVGTIDYRLEQSQSTKHWGTLTMLKHPQLNRIKPENWADRLFLRTMLRVGKKIGPFPAATYRLIREDVAELRRDYPDEYQEIIAKWKLSEGELPPDKQLQDFHFDVRCHVGFRQYLPDYIKGQ